VEGDPPALSQLPATLTTRADCAMNASTVWQKCAELGLAKKLNYLEVKKTVSLGSFTEVFNLAIFRGEKVDEVKKVVMGGNGSNEPEMVESDNEII
jgi:hypothetical protein